MKINPTSEIETFEAIDLKRLFDLLKHNLWLLLLCLLLGGGAAFAISTFQTPIYQAKTQVIVTRSSTTGPVADLTQTLNAQQLGQTYVELLSQNWVLDQVSKLIGGEIHTNQIEVSAATNTLVINISAEDPSPARAKRIADSLVQVLIAQNEAIQATRYNEAEQGLNLQIQQVQTQIAETQTQLDLAKTTALEDKVTRIQAKIEETILAIDTARTELQKMDALQTTGAQAALAEEQTTLEQTQAKLSTLLDEYQALINQLETDPLVQQESQLETLLQSQVEEKNKAIAITREQLIASKNEIAWLTPLAKPGALEKAYTNLQEFLALQETVLEAYRKIYTDLLISEDNNISTDQVAKLEKDLALYQQIYLNLLNSRETVRLQKMQNMPNVIQVNPAVASNVPVRPRILFNTMLGALSGLILSITAVLLVDFLDTTIKTREDVERVLDLPVIGYIMQLDKEQNAKDGPYVLHAPRSPASEAFRSLRSNLEFIGVDQPLKSILISSTNAAEGKTTVAANLAAVLAQSGKRVVLVDADLRRPRLHSEMGLVNHLGLSDIFRDKADLKSICQPWGQLTLSVITSGAIPPNPAELLGSEKMRKILDQLEAEFDIVIFDSTPTLVTDSQLIAARVDGVLLVLKPGVTRIGIFRETIAQLQRAKANLLGIVLNDIDRTRNGYYSDYYHTYTNYYTTTEKKNKPRKPKWLRKPKWMLSKSKA